MPESTKKNLIVITYPDGDTVTLDAEKGDWTEIVQPDKGFPAVDDERRAVVIIRRPVALSRLAL